VEDDVAGIIRHSLLMSVYAVAARAPPRVVPVAFEQVGHDVTADGAVLRAGAEILPL
jgi:hypothetical protein